MIALPTDFAGAVAHLRARGVPDDALAKLERITLSTGNLSRRFVRGEAGFTEIDHFAASMSRLREAFGHVQIARAPKPTECACGERILARGMCSRCYRRARREASP